MKERDVGGITCSQVLALLGDLLDGALATPERARLEAHVRGCPACDRFGGRLGEIVAALRATSTDVPDDVAARLDARLRDAESGPRAASEPGQDGR